MARKKSGRMTDIPQLGLEFYVDDEGDITKQAKPSGSPLLSPLDIIDSRSSFITHGMDAALRRRGTDASLSGPRVSPQLSPHKVTNSASSFEGRELDGGAGPGEDGRRGSVGNILEVLDNSAWGESIRRSLTVRRSRRGSS
ncbi:hypothetical protein BDZ45DRAFT_422039 [Acephala macrosclerotiorum]|nr:hypothetical protein BDZ45DRAFT_422039 [Acephala macrosclerotiorum]